MADQTEGKVTQAATAPASPTAAEAKAAAAATKKAAEDINRSRRRIVWACIWGYLGVNLLMFLRFFFPRALYEPNTIFGHRLPRGFRARHRPALPEHQSRLDRKRTGSHVRNFRALHASGLHA